jgi:hypothetical protein
MKDYNMKTLKSFSGLLTTLVAASLLTACGSGGGSNPVAQYKDLRAKSIPVTTVQEIAPPDCSLDPNIQQITAPDVMNFSQGETKSYNITSYLALGGASYTILPTGLPADVHFTKKPHTTNVWTLTWTPSKDFLQKSEADLTGTLQIVITDVGADQAAKNCGFLKSDLSKISSPLEIKLHVNAAASIPPKIISINGFDKDLHVKIGDTHEFTVDIQDTVSTDAAPPQLYFHPVRTNPELPEGNGASYINYNSSAQGDYVEHLGAGSWRFHMKIDMTRPFQAPASKATDVAQTIDSAEQFAIFAQNQAGVNSADHMMHFKISTEVPAKETATPVTKDSTAPVKSKTTRTKTPIKKTATASATGAKS